MKKVLIFIFLISIIAITSFPSHAFIWMIYHKPAFKGKVIDAEIKEPIEGAVVVAIYNEDPIISGPGGGGASIIHIKETLTDKNGEFYIFSYTTIINPNAMESEMSFIIFKPGYGSFPNWRVSPPPKLMLSKVPYGTFWYGERDLTFEEFFSGKVGTVEEFWGREIFSNEKPQKIKIALGVVELPKLKTREERLNSLRSANLHGEVHWKKIKKLMRLINEEYKSLGITPYKEEE